MPSIKNRAFKERSPLTMHLNKSDFPQFLLKGNVVLKNEYPSISVVDRENLSQCPLKRENLLQCLSKLMF